MTSWGTEDFVFLADKLSTARVDILMLNPDYLNASPDVSREFDAFYDRHEFAKHTTESFERLKAFALKHNSKQDVTHRVRIKAFRHFQTFNMVMIDPDGDRGEMVLGFYMFQLRKLRPRIRIRRAADGVKHFDRFRTEYDRLWENADSIV